MTTEASAGSIVCGVDDSREAARAVGLAESLAGSLGLRLVLVHAARAAPLPRVAPFGAGYPSEAVENLAALSLEAGGRLIDRVVRGGPPDPERRVVIGPPAQVLCDVAEREDAALLVIGSRGRGSIAGAVLGSVSTDVIASAPCPVVVVPGDGPQPDG